MIRPLYQVLLVCAICCTQITASAQNKLEPEAFEAMLKKDSSIQLIDVRTPEEFGSGHLNGALNLNYNSPAFEQDLQSLDKKRPVLVYCAMGGRSAKAARLISKLKFQTVIDLDGGINAWKAAGKQVSH